VSAGELRHLLSLPNTIAWTLTTFRSSRGRTASESAVPHSRQNFAPAGLSLPHRGHVTLSGNLRHCESDRVVEGKRKALLPRFVEGGFIELRADGLERPGIQIQGPREERRPDLLS
jgi:hypothetical protein